MKVFHKKRNLLIKCYFSNDCDEIRPALRNQLLRDSKLCQLEQIQDQKLRLQEKRDFDDAWHQVLFRDFEHKTSLEKSKKQMRAHEGKAVEEVLKQQMIDKIEKERIHEEINEWNKQFAKDTQKDAEDKIEKIRSEFKKREDLKDDILKQIHENRALKKRQLERELKIDQIFNDEISKELQREEEARKNENVHFKREVFHYLDYLRMSRHQSDVEEREKEKLIEDVRRLKCDDDWFKRCDFYKKRVAVNQDARRGQVYQMNEQEKQKRREAMMEKDFNKSFNLKEMKERELMREEKWQMRLKNFHYGQELLGQQKCEELKRLADKQKLEEDLMLIEKERLRCEEMGKEFVKSSQDVLPLHPNLKIILKGKKYQF